MISLENETHLQVAPRRQFAAGPPVNRFALPLHRALVRTLQSTKDLQQRTLAGARGTLDRVESLARKCRIQAMQDFEVGPSKTKRLVQSGTGKGKVGSHGKRRFLGKRVRVSIRIIRFRWRHG